MNPVGTLVPQGSTALQPRDRPLGGSSPQKPSKINQSDGVSMGLHGPASRKTLTL